MEFQAKVGPDGRITIPKWVREDMNIEPEDIVIVQVKKVIKREKRKNSQI
ncbi:AbrB/MazE/SpoVT family DNA-binding domain-containing protein [Archaeoglobus sp.]